MSTRGTTDFIDQGLYAVSNLFVIPATMIVAFEPADTSATVLDAADHMMRNVYHPARAPETWDQASGHSEIRDEIVAKLHDTEWLSVGEALYLGPRTKRPRACTGRRRSPIDARTRQST